MTGKAEKLWSEVSFKVPPKGEDRMEGIPVDKAKPYAGEKRKGESRKNARFL